MAELAGPVLCSLLGYLCGSVPFGLLIGWWVTGKDIRQHGSRNIGATNCGRVAGRTWGLVAFSLDVGKGVVPVVVLAALVGRALTVHESAAGYLPVVAGLGAILGHVLPVWLGFRGGKGVATALGVALGLNWLAAAIGFGVWALTVAVTRYVSLGSMLGASAFAVAAIVMLGDPLATGALAHTLFYVAVPTLVIARHRANIGRLLRGEENRLGRKGAGQAAEPADPS